MGYNFLKAVSGAALLAVSGQALAQASGSDTVQVSLTVDVSRSISLALDGDVALSTEQLINESFEGSEPISYSAYTGYTTGCLALSGLNNVAVKVTGANRPGLAGMFLNGSEAANGVHISYLPVLAIGAAGVDFSNLFADSRSSGDNRPYWLYYNYDPLQNSEVNGYTQVFYGASDALGSSSCADAGANIAVGAMATIDGGPGQSLPAGRIYRSINEFLDTEVNLPDGSYVFSDTVTVEITPHL